MSKVLSFAGALLTGCMVIGCGESAHPAATVNGKDIEIPSDSVCVHSDTPGAARLAEAIVQKLKENDIEIRPLGRAKQKIS